MTLYISAGNEFVNACNALYQSVLEISNYCLHVQEIRDFRSIPSMLDNSGDKKPVLWPDSEIEFKNVSFKYPGAEIYALKNLNITIKVGQKLCIVGQNGSGKSTFVNLLTGIYYPTEGDILLDGISICNYNRVEYMKLFSPVFQKYSLYSMQLGLNIAFDNNYDKEKLKESIDKSGLRNLIQKLPDGTDTNIGKRIYETGIEPSGGEGQKIAIARSIYYDRPIYILDEPTAALDPVTEYDIYSTFSVMISDHTAVMITHRLSAVQLADKIAVFDNGHVAEYGAHADLYAQGGLYTKMFDKQAEFYRDNPDK